MAAISTLAAVGGGLLLSALTHKKGPAAPTPTALPATPDPAIAARAKQEAAQRAASFARLRSSAQPTGAGAASLTGPAGIPAPAPVARKALLGQ